MSRLERVHDSYTPCLSLLSDAFQTDQSEVTEQWQRAQLKTFSGTLPKTSLARKYRILLTSSSVLDLWGWTEYSSMAYLQGRGHAAWIKQTEALASVIFQFVFCFGFRFEGGKQNTAKYWRRIYPSTLPHPFIVFRFFLASSLNS